MRERTGARRPSARSTPSQPLCRKARQLSRGRGLAVRDTRRRRGRGCGGRRRGSGRERGLLVDPRGADRRGAHPRGAGEPRRRGRTDLRLRARVGAPRPRSGEDPLPRSQLPGSRRGDGGEGAAGSPSSSVGGAGSVSEAQALDYVAGGMPFNDVSARDLQMRTSQWTAGKAIDTFAPSGPALVLGTETGDLQSLRIEARVNGDTLQSGTTADMIFSIAETIAFLSQFMTLEPGDIIATGTPAGVGFTREPPVRLRAGDRVEVEVEGLGVLSNPVIDERPPD